MKKIVSALLLIVFAFYLITLAGSAFDVFNPPAGIDPARVSNSFIHKNVQGGTDTVVFNESTNLENGSANIATAIVVDYRSFDTLGEVTVLFISALGVGMLLKSGESVALERGFILRAGAKFITPIVMVTGVYIFTHGHLTPGGGFPGGSMIAAASLLYWLGTGEQLTPVKSLKAAESTAGIAYVLVGLTGLVLMGSFLQNFMDTGVIGELFSAGVIPFVYSIIGIKVGSEVSGVLIDSSKMEVVS